MQLPVAGSARRDWCDVSLVRGPQGLRHTFNGLSVGAVSRSDSRWRLSLAKTFPNFLSKSDTSSVIYLYNIYISKPLERLKQMNKYGTQTPEVEEMDRKASNAEYVLAGIGHAMEALETLELNKVQQDALNALYQKQNQKVHSLRAALYAAERAPVLAAQEAARAALDAREIRLAAQAKEV